MKTYNVTLPNGEVISKTSSDELKTLWITYHPKRFKFTGPMGKQREINPLEVLKNCKVDEKGRCFRYGFSSKENPRIIPLTPFKTAKSYKRNKLKLAIKALRKEYRQRCKVEIINLN